MVGADLSAGRAARDQPVEQLGHHRKASAAQSAIFVGELSKLLVQWLRSPGRARHSREGIAGPSIGRGLLLPGVEERAEARPPCLGTLVENVPAWIEAVAQAVLHRLPVGIPAGLRPLLRLLVREPSLDPSLHRRLFFGQLLLPGFLLDEARRAA